MQETLSLTAIKNCVKKPLEDLGFELFDAALTAKKGFIICLTLDRKDEKPITVDDCARVSRSLTPLLQVHVFEKTPFDLEVRSPGIERPLRSFEDYVRFCGRAVFLKIFDPEIVQTKPYEGILENVSQDGFVLSLHNNKKQLFSYDHVKSCRLHPFFKPHLKKDQKNG